jgi:hypothetical protein
MPQAFILVIFVACPVEAWHFMPICTGFHTKKTPPKMLANSGTRTVGYLCILRLYGLLSTCVVCGRGLPETTTPPVEYPR